MTTKQYYLTLDHNGTEDEITLYTPDRRPMLCVGFWDDPAMASSVQLKADAVFIVNALNAYRPKKPSKKLTEHQKRMAKIAAGIRSNLGKPMPKRTVYKATV